MSTFGPVSFGLQLSLNGPPPQKKNVKKKILQHKYVTFIFHRNENTGRKLQNRLNDKREVYCLGQQFWGENENWSTENFDNFDTIRN